MHRGCDVEAVPLPTFIVLLILFNHVNQLRLDSGGKQRDFPCYRFNPSQLSEFDVVIIAPASLAE